MMDDSTLIVQFHCAGLGSSWGVGGSQCGEHWIRRRHSLAGGAGRSGFARYYWSKSRRRWT